MCLLLPLTGEEMPVSFRGMFVDFGQGKQKSQHLFSGDAGKITIAKLGCKTGEDELTGFDGIFFWSWPGDTADGNRLLVLLS